MILLTRATPIVAAFTLSAIKDGLQLQKRIVAREFGNADLFALIAPTTRDSDLSAERKNLREMMETGAHEDLKHTRWSSSCAHFPIIPQCFLTFENMSTEFDI